MNKVIYLSEKSFNEVAEALGFYPKKDNLNSINRVYLDSINLNYTYKPIEEPKLMTREEAVEKAYRACKVSDNYSPRPKSVIENDITILETLGLIKFKEEKKRFEFYNPRTDEIIRTNDIHEASNLILDSFVLVKDNGLVTKNG